MSHTHSAVWWRRSERTGPKNRTWTSAVRREIGLGILLVLSVSLLTLLFSFLGTIACGAMIGMMAGATRQWKWQIVLVSLVFPGVIMGFMQISKANLGLRESTILSALCFGVFWAMYLLSWVLISFEKQYDASSEKAIRGDEGERPSPGDHTKHEERTAAGSTDPDTSPPLDPSLNELQGTWSQRATALDGLSCTRLLQVSQGQLTMSIIGRDSQVRCLWRKSVRVERLGPYGILTMLDPAAGASPAPSDVPPNLRPWIYRVSGQTLTIAANFDETAHGLAPIVESYDRVAEM